MNTLFTRFEIWMLRKIVRAVLRRSTVHNGLVALNAVIYREVSERCHEENVYSWVAHMRDAVKYGAIVGAANSVERTAVCQMAERQGF